ncbi:alcohol dehydrogenase catalytic domain-containing protein [Ruminococcus sp. OA3]|uniref:zinc-dependent alcohol dehydrogenase n=1 Tax=Ruminococcus sp. OA3 TaxID=2914164 RepID=UPI001F058349|nr:zinc-binding dehydrogenase [Ruminococcus sp. OA3]MCH1981719.1 alcohol dehydrogenase catalytic domain-containing protein [Ruminococcus sp. OA3]
MRTVDACYIVSEKQTDIRKVELDAPGLGELQIEVKACGICAWDSYLFLGRDMTEPFPFRFGHEAVGVVAAVGEGVTGFKAGDQVFCIEGGPELAQMINISSEKAAHLPLIEEKDFPYYVCEPAACVISGINCIDVHPGDDVAVIGCGYMGLLNVQAFRRSLIGRLICFDIDPKKLEIARECGADECYLSDSPEGKAAIEDMIKKGGIDLVVECSGSQPGLQLACDLVRTCGTISNFAWHRGERTINCTPWHLRGIEIVNTSDARDPHFPLQAAKTANLVKAGVFDQRKLVTHIMDYHKIQDMLMIAHNHTDDYIKGVITF